MQNLYPRIDRWIIPEGVLAATLKGVRPPGRCGRESGAFWLGARAAIAQIRIVVLPAGPGVEESPGQWLVSPEVFGAVTRWAKPRGLTLLGIVHTHVLGVPPRLSWADRHLTVQVPGILAIVIGNGGEDSDYREWGWYVYEESGYRELVPSELAERLDIQPQRRGEVWHADAHGLRR